jgi:glyoxylase I family protein
MKLHHIAIIASDYAQSKQFYTEVLEMTIIHEAFRTESQSYKLDLMSANGELRIELFGFPSPPPRPTRPEACGLRHIAFSVSDLDKEIARLAERGVTCEPIRIDPYTGKRFTFFFDPSALPLELYEELT